MTTAQTKGILAKLIQWKWEEIRKGSHDLAYKLTEEEAQDMRECLVGGEVPTEWIGIKLEMK